MIHQWPISNVTFYFSIVGTSVVHFMTEEARSRYDLETLWALGSEFDDETEEMIRLNRMRGVFDSKVVK